jgi:NitT/TauT family transport system ATP-binding protein/taurine transport system ATP-binding protein
MALLTLRGIELVYDSRDGPVHALTEINLAIQQGDFVCVVGPSGCGKTTLLQIIAGFLFPTDGQALIDDRLIIGPDADRGVVFQQPALYPWLSVTENVGFGLKVRGVDGERRTERVGRFLRMVGLEHFQKHPPYELSGGMQQRAAIARVLVNEPRIMLMDEPFGALDALTREHMQEELLKIWRATRTTVLFITHSVEEAVYLGTRVLVMSPRPGRIVADVEVGFSRQPGADSRTVKSRPAFIQTREEILSYIWQD